MNNFDNKTRTNKFESRRKNTKLMSILIVFFSIILLVLIAIWLFGGKDNKDVETKDEPQNIEENNNNAEKESSEEDNDEFQKAESNTEESDKSNEDNDVNNSKDNTDDDNGNDLEDTEIETEVVEPSDDNVERAYRGNWEPIGTSQTGPHTTIFDKNSTDRNEMEQAIRMVTGLDDNMITWWLTNGGPEKVVATVSDGGQNQTYRVYLSWIENEGWQPTVIEELKVNDKRK